MATEPWSGARYPASTAAPNVPQDLQNAVNDLGKFSGPIYASTSARDTAFTNWLAAGNSAISGMRCFTTSDGRYWSYDTGTSSWKYAGGKPPPIVAVTAQNSFWGINSGHQPGAYMDSNGLVHLIGQLQPTVGYNPTDGASRPFMVIPAGYRPLATQTFLMIAATTPLTVVTVGIDSTGTGYITDGTTTSVPANIGHFLDGITYHTTYNNATPLA